MAEENEIQNFRNAFAELKAKGGEKVSPYPWQERLFLKLSTGPLSTETALDIPTGLGKTSIIEIWLLAHLLGKSKPPTRLVYVVNRRTIVDQATNIALELKDSIKKVSGLKPDWELAVSPLRGALADNREWMRNPHRPAIIIGTVDMIGSRLLFDAYRAGKWTKAMHAGLLGQDSLLVHDEAHLSQPFQKLLEWILQRQAKDHSPRPMRLLAMSATGLKTDQTVLGLDENDLALKEVDKKINAIKRLKVHPFDQKVKASDRLAEVAAAYDGDGDAAKRVIVFVRTPDTALKICDRLKDKYGISEERIALLTGTIRGHERDAMVRKPVLVDLLHSKKPENGTEYLVATSAGEVGADFDADHLVCDLTTLESMIQRFGRVNRRGKGDARIDVIADFKESDKLKDHEKRMLLTAGWLDRLELMNGDPDTRRLASPQAMRKLRELDFDSYRECVSAPPKTITPHDVTLDAWALTSIQANWPLSQPLDEYLHGKAEFQPPTASVAWRDEVSIFFPTVLGNGDDDDGYDTSRRQQQFETWSDHYPLRPAEIVTDKSQRVMDLLLALAKTNPDDFFIVISRRETKQQRFGDYTSKYKDFDANGKNRFCNQIAECTFILPTVLKGLGSKGMIDPSSADLVSDVADVAGDRWRVRLSADDDGIFTAQWLGIPDAEPPIVTPTNPDSWTAWRDKISNSKRKQILAVPLKNKSGRVIDMLLSFRKQEASTTKDAMVLLQKHLNDAGRFARDFANNLKTEVDPAVFQLAAEWHDLGKLMEKWQQSIRNLDLNNPLAKSWGKGMDIDSLRGYRHEFGSLIKVTKDYREKLNALHPDQQDLLLHLIASHHGRGRPDFPQGAFDADNPTLKTFGDLISLGEIARRYARLQLKYGHWGLAWVESLMMCADHAASRGEDLEDTK